MNIAEAKEYIKNTVSIYLKKDEYGDYRIPVMRQRPIFMIGAPGIGKTAIMEQVASELGIALVSYSMTHHTRQSALGLPFIEKKEYGGKTYDVSEYTMSEIIASIYETMERSGVKEGILFLDEINCVSETLAPSMLQFLQYKEFGRHSVPEGWAIVTAGNPPEFNRSVREFDVVTLDRLKVLEIEADYPAWRSYAIDKGLHSSILNFLDIKKDYFYHVETTSSGMSYTTARGWEDLSDIIYLYEESGYKVTETLIGQYIRNDKVVREFGAYYDLFNKYKESYRVSEILKGDIPEDTIVKASEAPLDEKLSLVGILLDTVKSELKDIMNAATDLKEMRPGLKSVSESEDIKAAVSTQIGARTTILDSRAKAGALPADEAAKHKRIRAFYNALLARLTEEEPQDQKGFVTSVFNEKLSELKERTVREQERIHNLFTLMSKAFGDESNEMLIAVTELTVHKQSAEFFATFGSEDYNRYNEILMVTDRKDSLRQEILNL